MKIKLSEIMLALKLSYEYVIWLWNTRNIKYMTREEAYRWLHE